MVGKTVTVGVRTERLQSAGAADVRDRAREALRNSDFSQVLESVGIDAKSATASAALRTVLAERLAECAIGAMQVAEEHDIRPDAAAIVIAAHRL